MNNSKYRPYLTRTKPSRPQLLILGYIHRHEKQLNLSMYVPMGVVQTVTLFYPTVIGFGLHNKTHFIVSEHQTILKGHNERSCSGFMVYAAISEQDKNGYNSGVHTWSLKSLSSRSSHCYQSIGVTSIKPSQSMIIQKTSHWPNEEKTDDSYYSGYSKSWKENQIITVKLDCNNWNATYYDGRDQVKQDKLKRGRFYFLALSCCASNGIVHLKSVEFPGEETHFMHR